MYSGRFFNGKMNASQGSLSGRPRDHGHAVVTTDQSSPLVNQVTQEATCAARYCNKEYTSSEP